MFVKLAIGAAASLLLLAVLLGGMIAFFPPPAAETAQGSGGLDFAGPLATDLSDLPGQRAFRARDGTDLRYRQYGDIEGARRLIVLVHGSGWHGMQFHAMASRLAADGSGAILVPDLRGHGETVVRRGDVDHVGQLEEDLADLIDHATARSGGNPSVVLGGHSSGGGLVVRFAGSEFGGKADAFILMAPFLRHDAPTTRPNSGGWARPAVPRIIGLTILNAIGISRYDYLPVISFAMPKSVLDGPLGHTATTRYSHRMNVSFAPRGDFGADLAAMTQPFLVIAGADDEAFYADQYEPTISRYAPHGVYRIVTDADHLGIVSAPAALDAIQGWLDSIP